MEKEFKPTIENAQKNENTEAQGQKKYSYEELETICSNLAEERQKILAQLYTMEQILGSRRMDYLFRIVSMSDKFNGEFVQTCIKELEESMTIPEEKGETPAETEENS